MRKGRESGERGKEEASKQRTEEVKRDVMSKRLVEASTHGLKGGGGRCVKKTEGGGK